MGLWLSLIETQYLANLYVRNSIILGIRPKHVRNSFKRIRIHEYAAACTCLCRAVYLIMRAKLLHLTQSQNVYYNVVRSGCVSSVTYNFRSDDDN